MGRKDCGKTGLHFDRPSLVQIQFADDCDINITVKRFMRTGVMPPASGRTPITGDFTNIPDNLPDALSDAVRARQAFEQLPLEERNKWNNDSEAWAIAQVDKPVDKSDDTPADKPDDTPDDKPE